MGEKGKRKPEDLSWVVSEVCQARQKGLFVVIDGVYCETPEEAGHLLLVREEESYMKDYVGDDRGKIIGIAFDKVKSTNN